MSAEISFSDGDFVVYPAHGVGRVMGVETQHVAGCELRVYVIAFDKDRMTLRLPVAKSNAAGLRSVSSQNQMEQALRVLKTRSRTRRTMWSRRAQEYENKINSGDPVSIAEVIRDLHRNSSQPDQSYSERQIYKSALDRFTRELAIIERVDEETATLKIEEVLTAA